MTEQPAPQPHRIAVIGGTAPQGKRHGYRFAGAKL